MADTNAVVTVPVAVHNAVVNDLNITKGYLADAREVLAEMDKQIAALYTAHQVGFYVIGAFVAGVIFGLIL